jgi:hypothetical protein
MHGSWFNSEVTLSTHLSAALAATLAVAACSAAPRGAADPTPQPPPFPIGQMGVPVHAKAASGATADITLNSSLHTTSI